MIKKILELKGVEKLNKVDLKSLKGGNPILVPGPSCTYTCSGTTARLNNGNYIECPAMIHNASRCGGNGNEIEVWA